MLAGFSSTLPGGSARPARKGRLATDRTAALSSSLRKAVSGNGRGCDTDGGGTAGGFGVDAAGVAGCATSGPLRNGVTARMSASPSTAAVPAKWGGGRLTTGVGDGGAGTTGTSG